MAKDSEFQEEVLVVDDNDITRSLIKAILDGSGFTLVMCSYYADALKLSSRQYFKAFIIDYHLPNVKGDVLTAVFRKLHPAAIIIGCSVLPKERPFLQAGADYFILKENLPSDLLPTLTKAIASKK